MNGFQNSACLILKVIPTNKSINAVQTMHTVFHRFYTPIVKKI